MSFSAAFSSDQAKREERRGSPRETLQHCVVLVFFGEDNWGKLTNMSESGMALEFSRPPSLGERVHFTFQVMGCMPMPQNTSALGESFEVAGEIVWLREFERIAGVRFVDLAEGSRDQIRRLLALETSANTLTSKHAAKTESAHIETELPAPLSPLTPELEPAEAEDTGEMEDIKGRQNAEELLTALNAPEFFAAPELESESSLTKAMLELAQPKFAQRGEVVEWQRQIKSSPRSNPSVARLTFLVVSGCLAAFTVTAGIRIFMARAARQGDGAESALGSTTAAAGERASTSSVSSPLSSPVPPAISSAEAAPPFQVQVLDANGRSWRLWFAPNGDNPSAPKQSASADMASSAARTARRQEVGQTQEPQAPRIFTMVAPNLNRPTSNDSAPGNPSAEAPSIPTALAVPQAEPIGGSLNTRVAPPAPESNARTGGIVQQARLIRSIPPIYPALAKTSRVSGDVVVDALINAAGDVTSVKVLSGPVMLQQAAIETVRQWKYEPARLDGQAVAMHLTVTVRFRLN